MDRIGPAGGTPTVALSNGAQGFVNQNLSIAQAGTSVVANWLNALQEELMTLLSTAGITPDITNFTQVKQAILSLVSGANSGYANTSGYGYFLVPGTVPLKVVFGPCLLGAGVPMISQLLPISFDNAFLAGVVADNFTLAYGYGLTAGADTSHVDIWCPLMQIGPSGLYTRSTAGGYFIAVGR